MSTKTRELFLVERFLEVGGVRGKIVECREAPDFAISVDGRTIGLEVTELFRPCNGNGISLQAQESLEDRVIRDAKRAYEKAGGSPIHVTFLFRTTADFKAIRRDELADSISQLLLGLSLDAQAHTTWRNNHSDLALEPLVLLTVLPVRASSMAHWSAARSSWVGKLTSELLQSAISNKNEKVSEYRKNFDELWLLVATDSSRPSQMFNLEHKVPTEGIDSLFDRTYVLRIFSNQVTLVHQRSA